MPAIYFFMLTSTLFASNIDVSGNISSDAVWNTDTVKVTGGITVENGITLTIDPGTYVEFQGHYKLNVQGCILAMGAEADSIIFTAKDTATGWHGIRFDSTSSDNDSSRLIYCRISYGNTPNAGLDDDSYGGGVFINNSSNIIIENSSISNNTSWGYGGGIYCIKSRPKLMNNLISYNKATAGSGGGIHFEESSPTITNNAITNNSAQWNGGGIDCFRSSIKSINNVIINNSATRGGGVYAGGIYGSSISPNFINNTIANNSASDGSGLYCTYANPIFKNTILWGRVYLNNSRSDPRFTYCVVQGGRTGFRGDGAGADYTGTYENNLEINPDFSSLVDVSLLPTSPCINAGTPDTSSLGLPEFDIAGNPRIYNDTIDIGAYEFQDTRITVIYPSALSITAEHYTLSQNYPNPFNLVTNIIVGVKAHPDNLAKSGHASLVIYDEKGKLVKNLFDGELSSASHNFTWNGTDHSGAPASSGFYFIKLNAGDFQKEIRCMLVK